MSYRSSFNDYLYQKLCKMGRRKGLLPLLENVKIMDAGSEGKAVARVDDRVVFVPFAAPGDLVDVQVYKKKRSFYEGKVVRFHRESELRVTPKCSHFGLCGGCKWQHMAYETQLHYKQKQVKDAMDRIAKVPYGELLPIVRSDKQYYYRNKLEYTFSNRRWLTVLDISKEQGGPDDLNGLGFHLPGMFDKILDIENCYLQRDPSNSIRLALKEYAIKHGLSFYNVRNWEGLMRNIIIRTSRNGNLMVIVVFREAVSTRVVSPRPAYPGGHIWHVVNQDDFCRVTTWRRMPASHLYQSPHGAERLCIEPTVAEMLAPFLGRVGIGHVAVLFGELGSFFFSNVAADP